MQAQTNFQILNYEQELQNLERVSTDELVLSLRRQSKGFTRGSSRFRGVTRHQKGRWEARIGQLTGRKYRYLGLFGAFSLMDIALVCCQLRSQTIRTIVQPADSEIEAAIAYDREAVRQKGLDACTNFEISSYADVVAQRINDADGASHNGAGVWVMTGTYASRGTSSQSPHTTLRNPRRQSRTGCAAVCVGQRLCCCVAEPASSPRTCRDHRALG